MASFISGVGKVTVSLLRSTVLSGIVLFSEFNAKAQSCKDASLPLKRRKQEDDSLVRAYAVEHSRFCSSVIHRHWIPFPKLDNMGTEVRNSYLVFFFCVLVPWIVVFY